MLALGALRPGKWRGRLRPPFPGCTGPGRGQAGRGGAGRAVPTRGSEPRARTPLGVGEPCGGVACSQEQEEVALPLV